MSKRLDQPGDGLVDMTRKGEQPIAAQDRKARYRRENDPIPVHGVLGT
jgi:hypothetical protein